MAIVSSESSTFSSCLIDVSFDLDEALTLPVNDVNFDLDEALTLPVNLSLQIRDSYSLVADMPAVAKEDVCSICMEDFQPNIGGKRVPCGHVYHAACISSWLSHRSSCPLCRHNISGRQ